MKFNFGNIKVNGSPLAYFVELSIFLFILWFMLSGRTEAHLLIMGAVFSLFTAYICAPFLIVRNENYLIVVFYIWIIVNFLSYLVNKFNDVLSNGISWSGLTREEGYSWYEFLSIFI